MTLISTSTLAVSDTYIYMRYNGSSYIVGSYAYTTESNSYDQILIVNELQKDGFKADENYKFCYNTSTCQTAEISTAYYSSSDYLSASVHAVYNGGTKVNEYAIIKSL